MAIKRVVIQSPYSITYTAVTLKTMKGIEIFLRKTKYVVIFWPNFENIVNNRSSRDVEVDFVIFFITYILFWFTTEIVCLANSLQQLS